MTQPTHSEEFCERCWSFDPLTGTRRDDAAKRGEVTHDSSS